MPNVTLITKPCECCGVPVTKSLTQQHGRKFWTCTPHCARLLKVKAAAIKGWPDDPLRGQKDTRPCENCGKPVTRHLSQRRNAQFWTCSPHCMGIVNIARRKAAGTYVQPHKPRRGQDIACIQCGTVFYRGPNSPQVHCSTDCANITQTKTPVIKFCVRCGKELRLKPSQARVDHCSRECESLARIKYPLDRMHNGKPARLNGGYVLLWEPSHPNKTLKGWQPEHRLVVEQAIGRYLSTEEQVDHINEVKDDNRLENLQVLSASVHSRKTQAFRNSAQQLMREELAEYRRRYGQLPA